MLRLPLVALILAFSASTGLAGVGASSSEVPSRIWIAPLGEAVTLEAAWEAGAEVRDCLPEALLLADPRSARTLERAGFDVEGPYPVPEGHLVTLLRARETSPPAGSLDHDAVAAMQGVRVLWTDGVAAVVSSPGVLPPHDAVRDLGKKVLEAKPMRRPRAPADSPDRAVVFSPVVDEVVAQVDSSSYFPWIERLAGADPIVVGGQAVTLSTRYTMATQCETAEQYVYEQFVEMGYTDVAYESFPIQSTTARNVIATIPGTETPERIYVLCGHLDSTSPTPYSSAPGANDNASGTAAVLTAASILKDYSFQSTVRFIAFTGEEQGLVGSAAYAAAASARGDDIAGVVNCDMIAFWSETESVLLQTRQWAEPLLETLTAACVQYTGLATEVAYMTWGSDHVSFLQRGYPAIMAIESDHSQYPCYHQTCDTADRNLGSFGAEVTAACVATICHLAGVQGATFSPETGPAVSTLSLEARPNPCAGPTTLRFTVSQRSEVQLTVHDVAGRRLRTLRRGVVAEGPHEVHWDGTGRSGHPVPAGVYFVRMHTGSASITERIVRLR